MNNISQINTITLSILIGRDEVNLNRCVESIKKLSEYPNEVIIVKDINYCKIRDSVIENIFEDLKNKIKFTFLHYSGNMKQPDMRNLALKKCNSEFIWFVDDDVYLQKDSLFNLKKIINQLEDVDKKIVIAGSIEEKFSVKKPEIPIKISPFIGIIGYFNWELKDYKKKIYKELILKDKTKLPIVPFCQGTNMIFNTSLIKEIGGFNLDLSGGYSSFEDSEPSFTIANHGYKTIYAPSVKLIHFKENRVGNSSRVFSNIEYSRAYIKNYTISLISNNYPSKIKARLYPLIYIFYHSLRMLKSNFKENRLINPLVYFKYYLICLKGFYEGYKTANNGYRNYLKF